MYEFDIKKPLKSGFFYIVFNSINKAGMDVLIMFPFANSKKDFVKQASCLQLSRVVFSRL